MIITYLRVKETKTSLKNSAILFTPAIITYLRVKETKTQLQPNTKVVGDIDYYLSPS